MSAIQRLLDHRFGSFAAAGFAGLCIAGSMPPWGWWPLAFAGLALLDRLIAHRPPKERFWRGFIAGLAWFIPASAWMVAFTIPGWVIFGLWGAAVLGAACAAIPTGAYRWLAFPAVLVLLSFTMWRVPFGGVPLATLAMSQVGGPLAGLAPLLGSLLIVAATGVVAVALRAALGRKWRSVGVSVGIVAAAGVFAATAPGSEPTGSMTVAVVQGGGPQGTRALYTSSGEVFERHVEATRSIDPPSDGDLDLVVWPENAVTTAGPFTESDEYGEVTALAAELNAPIATSIFEEFATENYNATVVVSPDGSITNRYDKVIRVPFGEYVPFRAIIEPFAPEYMTASDAVAGTEPNVVVAPHVDGGDTKLGVSISWEVFFDRRSRDAANDGAEVLINPTNGSSYSFTIVQSQQIASSRLRARETDRWMLQAAPTGFSAIIDNHGTVEQRTGVSEQKVLIGPVEIREGTTLATKLGDWPMLVISVIALGSAWITERRSERSVVPELGGGNLDQDGDGTVVDKLDSHLGAEASGLDDQPSPP